MSLKKQIINGTFWTMLGQVGYMLVSLVATIILARILTPFEFGQMGILMFFVMIANILAESGFSAALIRRKIVGIDEYSTVFVFNMVMSLVCYFLIYVFSDRIAEYYNNPQLRNLLLGISLVFIINSITNTQNAKLIIELKFRKISGMLFCANLLAAILGIICAYCGFGAWALVIFFLFTAVFNSIMLLVFVPISFRFRFKWDIFKDLFSFGINTTITSVLATIFDNIYQLILGRYFSMVEVGYFYQAKKLQIIPFTVLNNSAQIVIFSSLAKLQDDKNAFIKVYNKLMMLFTILMASITCLIFVYSNSIINIIFGPKWEGSIYFMQILVISSFFYFQELFNNIIFKVFNKTKMILFLELVKKIIQTISIIIGLVYHNINILLLGFVVTSVISYGINFYFSRNILGKGRVFEIYTVMKVILISCISVITISLLIDYLKLNFYTALWTIPLAILLFYVFLRGFKIIDLYKELNTLISQIRDRQISVIE